MKKLILELDGLDCSSCAMKIEDLTAKINGVDSVNLDFVSKKMRVNINNDKDSGDIKEEIKYIVKKLEPDVIVIEEGSDREELVRDHGNVNKKDIIQIILGGILLAIPWLFKLDGRASLFIHLLAYLIVGSEILIRAIKNLLAGQPFDEHFLMSIATIGAFVIGEYPEGVAVMLFYRVGEYFQGRAVNHSRKSISALMDIRPDYANLEKDGETVTVDPLDVHIGDFIVIRPGERVPLDGEIIEGKSSVDTSNITGESVPRTIDVGDEILSGFVNNEGLLRVKVKKEFGESTVSKILDLVENASSKKAPTENFITKFARYYTPVVVVAALLIGVIPPLFFGADIRDWAYKAFVFLVISCPCALVISIPLGFFGGIGGASKAGILIKGGNYLEGLNDVDTIVFDKTGTITKGTFNVTNIDSFSELKPDEILRYAAYGEYYSTHPIGASIGMEYGKYIDESKISNYKEIAGMGIEADIEGERILIGNEKLFKENNIEIKQKDSIGTVAYIGRGDSHIGTIEVSDEIKENAYEDIQKIKAAGIKETIMLSGDNGEVAKKVGNIVGIDKVYGNLLPEDKVNLFEEILKNKKDKGTVAFVGDGVNDAPVLARASIGIAMGGLGSDAAIEASDIVIMTDEIGKIATGIKIAKNTKKIVTQNIVFALGIKLIVLSLGAFGIATMWEAIFADVGVSIIAILNSIRALKVEE